MRFRRSKIARGKRLFEKRLFPACPGPRSGGPPSAKTFNVRVLTVAVAGRYQRARFRRVLAAGLADAPSYMRYRHILPFLNAHYYQTRVGLARGSFANRLSTMLPVIQIGLVAVGAAFAMLWSVGCGAGQLSDRSVPTDARPAPQQIEQAPRPSYPRWWGSAPDRDRGHVQGSGKLRHVP